LVAIQAAVAFFAFEAYAIITEHDWSSGLGVGDPIVYRKQKVSTHPCERAYEVHPAQNGDNYSYIVDKYWTVTEVLSNGQVVAVTRTNKRHYLQPGDPNLHRAKMIERIRYRDRFPRVS
jgi:hypothetical protein